MFHFRRQANNTNWRQQGRDEGDEWRSPDGARNRPNVDKWGRNKYSIKRLVKYLCYMFLFSLTINVSFLDRDWGERPVQDRPQSWSSNRRTWVGGEGHNDDNLPEWSVLTRTVYYNFFGSITIYVVRM